jgi:hypothetical protein
MQAPIFYDSANTAFYVDAASTSNLNALTTADTGTFGSARAVTVNGNNGSITIKGDAGGWATQLSFLGSGGTNHGGFGALGSGDGFSYHFIGSAYNTATLYVYSAGYAQASGSLRAPIFYDSANTEFYGDFAGTSVLSGLTVTNTITGSITGNAATATNLSTNRTNWNTNGTITAVVGQLAWKNYGNNHTIFDASNSTSPGGSAVNNTNAEIAWAGTYPTLMGWNGNNTYGVRVDSARVSDSISGFNNPTTAPTASTIVYRDAAGDIAAREIVLSSGLSAETPTVLTSMYPTTNQLVRTTPGAVAVAIRGAASGSWGINITGTAQNGNHLNSTRDTPSDSLQYWQAPGLGTTEAPSGDWHNTIRMGHGSPLSYYSNTLAIRMTGAGLGDIYTQTIAGGVAQGWKKHWNDGNDGAGSGLDADLLDGVQGTNYFRCDGTYPNTDMNTTVEGYWHVIDSAANLPVANYGHRWDWDHLNNGQWVFQMYSPTGGDLNLWFRQKRDYVATAWQKVWTSLNDGAGSGLDADTVDGLHPTNATGANTIVTRDGNGYTFLNYINSNTGDSENPTIGQFITVNSSLDGYYRKSSVQHVLNSFTSLSATWTGVQYFQSNKNTTDTGQQLQAYSSSGGATMSFHRAGVYAVNMGLDSDNVFRIGGWSAPANVIQLDMSGNFTALGNVTAYSDIRKKKDITTIENALDMVSRMRGVRFRRIDTDQAGVGVIAQEMLEVLPEVVQQGVGDDDTLSVAYGNIVGVLIEAIKEQQTRINTLEQQINSLKEDK